MQVDFLVDFPGLGIHDLPVNRVAFELFGWPVYWYGLLIALALLLCMVLAIRQAPRFGLKADDITDTFIAIIPLMIIMARLYYVVLEWDYYATDWRRIFNTRDGGLAFYGGIIGGIIAVLIIRKIKHVKLSSLFDFLVVYIPLGQAIGRWGNFFNQEAFGNNTSLPWGMYSNQTEHYLSRITHISGLDPSLPVHPTFFYEFVANMIIFVFLLRIRRKSKLPFETTLWYFLLYGFVRFFVESIRTDPLMIPGNSLLASMILSAIMFVGSIILLIILRQRQNKLALQNMLTDDQIEQTAAKLPEDRADSTERDFIVFEQSQENTDAVQEPLNDTSEDPVRKGQERSD